MASVGIRELRQRASELLRLVEQGHTIEITDRGRPVALLTPMPDEGPLQQLRMTGEVERGVGQLADLSEPLSVDPGMPFPSQRLRELRRDER